jgi:hypothetical protein
MVDCHMMYGEPTPLSRWREFINTSHWEAIAAPASIIAVPLGAIAALRLKQRRENGPRDV